MGGCSVSSCTAVTAAHTYVPVLTGFCACASCLWKPRAAFCSDCSTICVGMTIYMYHGKQRGIDPKQLSRYACVLTTYTTMGMEAASKEDLRQGSSVSQPDDLPDSDEEDNTAALPGDNMTNQPVQELSRVLCVVTDRLSSTCYIHSFKAIKAIRRQSIFLLESFWVSSVEFRLCTKNINSKTRDSNVIKFQQSCTGCSETWVCSATGLAHLLHWRQVLCRSATSCGANMHGT